MNVSESPMEKTRPIRSWRLRFSLRLLLVLPFLVACYLTLGTISKRYGRPRVAAVWRQNGDVGYPLYVAPCIFEHCIFRPVPVNGVMHSEVTATYYVWAFGYVWKMPFERIDSTPHTGSMSADELINELSWGV